MKKKNKKEGKEKKKENHFRIVCDNIQIEMVEKKSVPVKKRHD